MKCRGREHTLNKDEVQSAQGEAHCDLCSASFKNQASLGYGGNLLYYNYSC